MQLLPLKETTAGHLGILLLLLKWKKCQINTTFTEQQSRETKACSQQPQQIRPEVVLPWEPNLTAEGRAQNRRATDNGILLFCLGWGLAEQKVVSLPWTASVESFCHKFVYVLLKTASDSFSSAHEPVEYRHTSFALHCCLLLRALREKVVEKCILLSSCHSFLEASVAHPCFPSTSSLLIWRNPVLFDVPCMKTVPYSCCPFQTFWCVFLC